MNPFRVRILVGHLGRSGVPIAAARLMRWARDAGVGRFDVVAIRGGDVARDVASLSDSLTVLEPSDRRSVTDALAVGLASSGHDRWADRARAMPWRVRTRRLPTPDVVLMHGAGAWPLVEAAGGVAPLVVSLHELQVAMDRSIPREARAPLYRRAERVLAVSRPVAELAAEDGAPPDRIAIVPGCVDDVPVRSEGEQSSGQLVVGMGEPSWRKGADRFVALAHELRRSHPSARCVWIGGQPSGGERLAVGRPVPVEWIEQRADPWEIAGRATLLVVPSREDPLPLVALEAGARGIPVIATASGGLVDVLANGRGRVIHEPGIAATHRAVAELLDDPEARRRMAAAAAAEIVDFTVDAVGPRWWGWMLEAARSGT